MTKSEIRSLSVAKLQLPKDAVVDDVGAGTGSVTIELALAAVADGCIYAIERNQEACDLIEENEAKIWNTEYSVHGLAPEAMEDFLHRPMHLSVALQEI